MSQVFHVGVGTTAEQIAAGTYPAVFTELIGPEDSEHGERYRFMFKDDKRTYIGFADATKAGPTTKNKLGRWLCGLAGKQPEAASVDVSMYVGKKYLLVYGTNQKGTVSLLTFSPIG